MAFRSLLILSLFFALAFAAPPQENEILIPKSLRMAKEWQLRALERARERLSNLVASLSNVGTNSECKVRRRKRISGLLEALRNARTCRYRSLGLSEYSRLRELCKERSEIRDDLTRYMRRCSKASDAQKTRCTTKFVAPLKLKLKESFEACRTIGWKGDGRVERDNCPSIVLLKKRLARATAIECGTGGSEAGIREDIKKTRARIAYLESLVRPSSSVEPRMV